MSGITSTALPPLLVTSTTKQMRIISTGIVPKVNAQNKKHCVQMHRYVVRFLYSSYCSCALMCDVWKFQVGMVALSFSRSSFSVGSVRYDVIRSTPSRLT